MKTKMLLGVILMFILSSCTSKTVENTIAVAYPVITSTSTVESAYPAPISIKTAIQAIRTVDITKVQVEGQIYYQGKPLAGYVFYLADILKDPKTGQEITAALDRINAPKSVSDEDGRIYFYDVKPGRYALMLISGIDAVLLLSPQNGQAILVTVSPGQIVDLGKIQYDDLPVD